MKGTRHAHFLAQTIACAVLAHGLSREDGRKGVRKVFTELGGDEEAITALVATYDRYLANMSGGGGLFPKEELPALLEVLKKHLGTKTDWGQYATIVYMNREMSHWASDTKKFHGWFASESIQCSRGH